MDRRQEKHSAEKRSLIMGSERQKKRATIFPFPNYHLLFFLSFSLSPSVRVWTCSNVHSALRIISLNDISTHKNTCKSRSFPFVLHVHYEQLSARLSLSISPFCPSFELFKTRTSPFFEFCFVREIAFYQSSLSVIQLHLSLFPSVHLAVSILISGGWCGFRTDVPSRKIFAVRLSVILCLSLSDKNRKQEGWDGRREWLSYRNLLSHPNEEEWRTLLTGVFRGTHATCRHTHECCEKVACVIAVSEMTDRKASQKSKRRVHHTHTIHICRLYQRLWLKGEETIISRLPDLSPQSFPSCSFSKSSTEISHHHYQSSSSLILVSDSSQIGNRKWSDERLPSQSERCKRTREDKGHRKNMRIIFHSHSQYSTVSLVLNPFDSRMTTRDSGVKIMREMSSCLTSKRGYFKYKLRKKNWIPNTRKQDEKKDGQERIFIPKSQDCPVRDSSPLRSHFPHVTSFSLRLSMAVWCVSLPPPLCVWRKWERGRKAERRMPPSGERKTLIGGLEREETCVERERGQRGKRATREAFSLLSWLLPSLECLSVCLSFSDSKARFLHRVSLLLRGVFGIVSLQTIQRVSLLTTVYRRGHQGHPRETKTNKRPPSSPSP